jgi:hypothetical protein
LINRSGGKPDQVGVLVRSLETVIQRYGTASVVPPWRIWTYSEASMSRLVVRGQPGRFSWRIALGGSDPQIELMELIQPVRGPSIYQEWIETRGFGLHHLGYVVEDLDGAIAEMEGAGYEVLQAGFGQGADGTGGFAYFNTEETLGFIVEAILFPRVRRPPESVWPTHTP